MESGINPPPPPWAHAGVDIAANAKIDAIVNNKRDRTSGLSIFCLCDTIF
jgi:hypothetical protein